MSLRKTHLRKTLVHIIALSSVFQGLGCKDGQYNSIESPAVHHIQKKIPLKMPSLTPEEQKGLSDFIANYSCKSPSAKKIFSELATQGAQLCFFERVPDKDNIFQAGESDENTLSLNRLIKKKNVSFDDTFFHEAEHVVHLKKAHQSGINGCSFSSLNDVYIYATLLEALAYRKAALCCMEYNSKGLSKEEIVQKAQEVFIERLSTKSKDEDERFSYEKDAIRLANTETNKLPNQIYFKQNPDWDRIVSLLSRGEVKQIPQLPQPTLTFLSVCLFREIQKNPNAESLNDLDISCILTNKSDLQKDEKAIKRMISNLLTEVYNMCRSVKPFSQETRNTFFRLVGYPTTDQMEQIKQKKISIEQVRELNLEKLKTSQLFDAGKELLLSPEVESFGIQDTKIFAKMLHFSKMILVPPKTSQLKLNKEKTR